MKYDFIGSSLGGQPHISPHSFMRLTNLCNILHVGIHDHFLYLAPLNTTNWFSMAFTELFGYPV